MKTTHPGLEYALEYPLFKGLFERRTRRMSKGIKVVPAGPLTYTSNQEPQPLDPLEEAVLIAATGLTGRTTPDRPFQDEQGNNIMGTPNLNMIGRAAGSPDNAQATHFFLINDSGTYFLRRPPNLQPIDIYNATPDQLIELAEACKQKILDHRLEMPREMPYYIGSNRFVSNTPGSTIFLPIVDVTWQYINGLMFLLTQPDGYRPAFTDEMKFNRYAGVEKWVRSGYLNKDMKIPLGLLEGMRAPLEAPLLLQNLMLVLQAMGLGGWIHASFSGPILTGNPATKFKTAFQFEHQKPRFKLTNILNWLSYSTGVRPNPVGLPGVIQGLCPPYVKDMSEAVDRVIKHKYAKEGVYSDIHYFDKIFKNGLGEKYIQNVPHYPPEVIEVTKDICNYIYNTYGRFPAHTDAIQVPGIWLQAHHLDLDYYDHLFRDGYDKSHALHQKLWHGAGDGLNSPITEE